MRRVSSKRDRRTEGNGLRAARSLRWNRSSTSITHLVCTHETTLPLSGQGFRSLHLFLFHLPFLRFRFRATRSLGPSLRPPAIVPFPNDTIAPFPINGSTPLFSPSVVSSRFIVNNPNVLHLRMYKLVYAAWELCCFACSPDKPDGNEIRLEGSEVGDRGSRLIERGACMCACV